MDFELKSLRSSLHSFIHPWIHSLTMHLPPNYVKHCTRWGITGEGSRGGKHKSEWLVSSRIEKPTFYWGRWAGARILCSREVLWEAHASSKEGMATHIYTGDESRELLEDHKRWHSKWGFEGWLRVHRIEKSGRNTSGREDCLQKGREDSLSPKGAKIVYFFTPLNFLGLWGLE